MSNILLAVEAETRLSSCVDDMAIIFNPFVYNALRKRRFDGGVILVHEVVLEYGEHRVKDNV